MFDDNPLVRSSHPGPSQTAVSDHPNRRFNGGSDRMDDTGSILFREADDDSSSGRPVFFIPCDLSAPVPSAASLSALGRRSVPPSSVPIALPPPSSLSIPNITTSDLEAQESERLLGPNVPSSHPFPGAPLPHHFEVDASDYFPRPDITVSAFDTAFDTDAAAVPRESSEPSPLHAVPILTSSVGDPNDQVVVLLPPKEVEASNAVPSSCPSSVLVPSSPSPSSAFAPSSPRPLSSPLPPSKSARLVAALLAFLARLFTALPPPIRLPLAAAGLWLARMARALFLSCKRLWHWYEERLETYPIVTQMANTGLLWGLGDFLAQTFVEGRRFHVHPSSSSSSSSSSPASPSALLVSPGRVILTLDFGGFFIGPIAHFWLIFLDRLFRRRAFDRCPRIIVLILKALLDITVMGTLFVLMFFLWGAIFIDETGFLGFANSVRTGLLKSLLAELVIWPAFQMFNFGLIPLHHQLLAVNCMTLVDSTFLSWARVQWG
eukprot:CAMPEP_0175063100 /NCGR_PEP_ID=MMETSP0052_2-20121109/14551_1 /TAXON_ID=51329 ORGANISM="Polytomella parva, Strain SAG 63-3" /NCGR_SAMPLE_ID=MMETSP0052_2 /ASSEMBLY_ACC=CAM_ASM_000194 /LENGTH=490 /DNA_ID=CAMNT_0016329225 /DNA_START=601 /DNA_END=2073 /DNA_ORIENTATION=-